MENTEQIVMQAADDSQPDPLVSGFFAIGIVINIALIIAYLVWAYRQWGKKESQGD